MTVYSYLLPNGRWPFPKSLGFKVGRHRPLKGLQIPDLVDFQILWKKELGHLGPCASSNSQPIHQKSWTYHWIQVRGSNCKRVLMTLKKASCKKTSYKKLSACFVQLSSSTYIHKVPLHKFYSGGCVWRVLWPRLFLRRVHPLRSRPEQHPGLLPPTCPPESQNQHWK